VRRALLQLSPPPPALAAPIHRRDLDIVRRHAERSGEAGAELREGGGA